MRVTFDSHVLGKVIFPEKRRKDPDYAGLEKISAALRDCRFQGFICESIGTLEAIENIARPEYFANRIPKSCAQVLTGGSSTAVTITIKTDHSRHPGLHNQLANKLRRARTLGMRLLYIPSLNIQLPGEFLNDPDFYESRLFETQAYADRFCEISDAIAARGIGIASVTTVVERLQGQLPRSVTDLRSGMQLLEYATNETERRSIAKAIGEWADGDTVASHIASGNDVLCTEDKGKSAGGASVFDDTNRNWLKETYNLNVASIRQLASGIGN